MLVQVDTPSQKSGVLLLGHMGWSAVAQIDIPNPRTRPAVDVADIAPLCVIGNDHEQPVLAASCGWCLHRRLQNLGEKFVGHRVRPEVSDRARGMERFEQPDFAHGSFLRRTEALALPNLSSKSLYFAKRIN